MLERSVGISWSLHCTTLQANWTININNLDWTRTHFGFYFVKLHEGSHACLHVWHDFLLKGNPLQRLQVQVACTSQNNRTLMFTAASNLCSCISLGGRRSTQRAPLQKQDHANSTQKVPDPTRSWSQGLLTVREQANTTKWKKNKNLITFFTTHCPFWIIKVCKIVRLFAVGQQYILECENYMQETQWFTSYCMS